MIGFFGFGSLRCSICYYDVFSNVVLEKSGSRVGQHFFGAGLDATSKMKLKEI